MENAKTERQLDSLAWYFHTFELQKQGWTFERFVDSYLRGAYYGLHK